MTIRAAVVGSTGYTGFELVSLLRYHPQVELRVLTSQSYVGQAISQVFPALRGVCSLVCEAVDPESLAAQADVIFVALPHKQAMEVVPGFIRAGRKVVDLSADFRFRDPAVYEAWYQPHTARDLLAEAVYGLPELHADEIRKARLVGNPGCYPTGVILAIDWKQMNHFKRALHVHFGNPDFVKYAESFGAKGYRVERAEDLMPILKQAMADNTVSIIDCPVDYRENLKLTEKLGSLVCPL